MPKLPFLLLAACSVVASACSSTATGGGGSTSSSSGASGSINAQARQELAACVAGKTDAAIDDSLEITSDFKQSCHELVVDGGIALSRDARGQLLAGLRVDGPR